MRTGISITLKPADRRRLATLARDRNAPHKHVWRAEIVLLSADGVGTNEIMRRTGKSKTCVWRWQERFMQAGYDGLLRDKTRPSRIPPLGIDIAERVVVLTQTDPPAEATHWTATMMAKAVGISASSVQRIWRAHGLQPHRVRQFKLSNDPKFVDKLRDVVGLYVDPPAHAIVLSVDEKSQIQALDRTQPGLPMKKGRAGTMTHDYKRHGTTTLFAALDVLEGKVIGRCMQRHRHQEFPSMRGRGRGLRRSGPTRAARSTAIPRVTLRAVRCERQPLRPAVGLRLLSGLRLCPHSLELALD
jgi:transposase